MDKSTEDERQEKRFKIFLNKFIPHGIYCFCDNKNRPAVIGRLISSDSNLRTITYKILYKASWYKKWFTEDICTDTFLPFKTSTDKELQKAFNSNTNDIYYHKVLTEKEAVLWIMKLNLTTEDTLNQLNLQQN
jgi:hypothetical protein